MINARDEKLTAKNSSTLADYFDPLNRQFCFRSKLWSVKITLIFKWEKIKKKNNLKILNCSERGKTWNKDLHYELEESVRIFHSPVDA